MSRKNVAAQDKEDLIERNLPFIAVAKTVITKYGRKLGPTGIAVYCALLTGVDGSSREEISKNVAKLLRSSKRDVSTGLSLLENLKFLEFDHEGYVIVG